MVLILPLQAVFLAMTFSHLLSSAKFSSSVEQKIRDSVSHVVIKLPPGVSVIKTLIFVTDGEIDKLECLSIISPCSLV
jgi:hypothetical protein